MASFQIVRLHRIADPPAYECAQGEGDQQQHDPCDGAADKAENCVEKQAEKDKDDE